MSAAHVSGVYGQELLRVSKGNPIVPRSVHPASPPEFLNSEIKEKTYLSRDNFVERQDVQLPVLSSIGGRFAVGQQSKGFFQLLLEQRRMLAGT